MAAILTAHLRAVAARKFEWGRDDCASFVVEWLDLATGRRALPAWLGKYRNARSCRKFIRRNGGFSAIADAFFSEHYGIGRAASPAPGNVVLARYNGQDSMGIRIDSAGTIALRSDSGVFMTGGCGVLSEWGLPCLR